MEKYKRVYATINLDAILNNIEQMKSTLAVGTKIIAIIKADGYGHGAVQISRFLEEQNCVWGFAVATAEEAIILRKHNITKPVLVLGYVFKEHFQEMIERDVNFTVFSIETARELSKMAVQFNKVVKIHIKLDTGMRRIGFQCTQESLSIIKEISELPNIEIEGVFTHFAKADEIDKTSAMQQLKEYNDFISQVEEMGISIPIKHCSNSAGIIEMKDAHMDAVRAGIAMYGLYPSKEVDTNTIKLIPAMEFKSHIVHLKEVEAGQGISYGWIYTTEKHTKIATIPVGYADGYPRALSNKGWVLIRGQKASIIGRVCMDQFMVDVTDIEGVSLEDEVTLIGNDNGATIHVEELGDLSGRFNYEFVCDINQRVPRIFIKENKVVDIRDYFNE